MKKTFIKKIDTSKRNFLTGSVTLAGVAAATSVLPITIANANQLRMGQSTTQDASIAV